MGARQLVTAGVVALLVLVTVAAVAVPPAVEERLVTTGREALAEAGLAVVGGMDADGRDLVVEEGTSPEAIEVLASVDGVRSVRVGHVDSDMPDAPEPQRIPEPTTSVGVGP